MKTKLEKQNSQMPGIVPGTIRTFTGRTINIFEPAPELICIEDIAHALSNQCRFSGHTTHFYSVAEHSVHVARGLSFHNAAAGLLHDASEAYLVDLPTPIKMAMPFYLETEDRLMRIIAHKFGFEYPLHPDVVKEDKILLRHEWAKLMVGKEHTTQTPRNAEKGFISLFNQLKALGLVKIN